MKILSFNKKHGIAKLRISNKEDLWHLSKIISPGDLVSSMTSRKIQLSEKGERARSVRKPAYVKIETKEILFDHVSGALRIQGLVKKAPEDIPLGSAHTLSIEPGMEVKVEKTWRKYDMDRVRQAEKASPKVFICAFDDEDAELAIVSDLGTKRISSMKLKLARKAIVKNVEKEKGQLEKLATKVIEFEKELKPGVSVLASPAFWKDELLKVIKQKDADLAKRIKIESVSSGGRAGVRELLNKGILDKVSKESRLQKEISLIEEVRQRIAKKGLVTYGEDEVKKAAESGAVEVLLITDKFMSEKRDEVEGLITSVEKSRGQVFIVDSDNDPGKELEGLGGIASFLRFKI